MVLTPEQRKAWQGLVQAVRNLPDSGDQHVILAAVRAREEAEERCREVGFNEDQIRLIKTRPDTFRPSF